MSDGIKRMLAERDKLKARSSLTEDRSKPYERTAWDDRVDETFDLLARAAPFMDEMSKPGEWPPSVKLKLVYCIVATCPDNHPDKAFDALKFIHEMLAKARQLWVDGYHPDPWCEIPVPRGLVT